MKIERTYIAVYDTLSSETPEEAISNFNYSILIDTDLHSPKNTECMKSVLNKVIQFANNTGEDRLKLITLSRAEDVVYTYTLVK